MGTSKDYYQSHLKLDFIAIAGQEKLGQTKVLVIGAGGLGCPCLLALAGCGIGTLGIADGDVISLSNLSRQTLFNFSDVGQRKTTVAIRSLQNRNPYIRYREHPFFIQEENILSLIADYDIIVDATDNFHARYLINDACVVQGKSLVYGAIFKTEGQLTVFNHQQSPTLRCLFPDADNQNSVPSCADVGAYTITTTVIGTLMANEVIKIVLGHETVLSGKLLTFDALTGKTGTVAYPAQAASRKKSQSRFINPEKDIEVEAAVFLEKIRESASLLIDVRTGEERDVFNIGGRHLPLNNLENPIPEDFLPDQNLYFYCESGARSLHTAKIFRKNGFKNSFSLKGGLIDLKKLL